MGSEKGIEWQSIGETVLDCGNSGTTARVVTALPLELDPFSILRRLFSQKKGYTI